ncbi:alpha/beta hydrolase [Singulisphaera sp. PoT]|uniref:alpha/beta hydrolase n=1 Tax=Singulisphaera sp. PoT TaxID=3411797 RepID=UPI003BF5E7D7
MPSRWERWTWIRLVATTLAVALTTVGVSLAQNPPAKQNAAGKGKNARNKGRDAKGEPLKKALPNAGDPIENQGLDADKNGPAGMVHYRLKLKANDGTLLAVTYYPTFPARLGTNAPVLLMIHEKDRSGKDFEDPIAELKNQGIAEHMQSLGYAVLTLDLRGQGANVRKALSQQDWQKMIDDVQAAYQFLVDRHNRGKLNLAKFGVLALGEGANLAAAWANSPGGAVSSEGRTSDLGALVLVSPMAEGEGFGLKEMMAALGPRIPLLVLAGERDQVSKDPVRAARAIVERTRLNRVEFFPSSLHGYKLLRLEPKVTSVIAKFFEGMVKNKAVEWEPRYNLTPVAYGDIQLVRTNKTPNAAEKEKEKKDAGKEKAKEKDREKEKDAAPAKQQEPQ